MRKKKNTFLSFQKKNPTLFKALTKRIKEAPGGWRDLDQGPPDCVITNGTDSERCDVWVADPTRLGRSATTEERNGGGGTGGGGTQDGGQDGGQRASSGAALDAAVIVTLRADVRAIPSRRYASGFSLRFPRVERLRDDKTWDAVTTAVEYWRVLDAQKGRMGREVGGALLVPGGGNVGGRRVPGASARRGGGPRVVVASMRHLPPPPGPSASASSPSAAAAPFPDEDLDRGFPTTRAAVAARPLSGLKFCVAVGNSTLPAENREADRARRTVRLLGGELFAAATPSVTHVLGRRPLSSTPPAAAAAASGHAVVSLDWLREVASGGGRLVALLPRHFLCLGLPEGASERGSTRAQLARRPAGARRATRPEAADRFGDPLFAASSASDVEAVLDRFMADVELTASDVVPSAGGGSGGGGRGGGGGPGRGRGAAPADRKSVV